MITKPLASPAQDARRAASSIYADWRSSMRFSETATRSLPLRAAGARPLGALLALPHVDRDPTPERYRLYGAEYDIEFDHSAWEWSGWWEELAIGQC